jgi:competence CoiA-like predicted nuclease
MSIAEEKKQLSQDFICPICNKKFTTKYGLKKHIDKKNTMQNE